MDTPGPAARLAAAHDQLLAAIWAIVQSPETSPWARMRAKAGIQDAGEGGS